ncbi:hypothetical protein [Streptomyces sp. NPDC021562]|uniref:hypothetical protein n=1 Tax=Streptomyces sp. NPDC021562 TaxID=3155121 RepID=UPI0033F64F90
MGKLIFGFDGDDFADAPAGAETVSLSDGQCMATTDGNVTHIYVTEPVDTDRD